MEDPGETDATSGQCDNLIPDVQEDVRKSLKFGLAHYILAFSSNYEPCQCAYCQASREEPAITPNSYWDRRRK